jgi:serine/threonine protein kinase
MNSNDNDRPEWDDPRVVAALDEYVEALEAGHKPDRQTFLARHAAIADALAECLDGMEALHAKVESGEWRVESGEKKSGPFSPLPPLHSPLSADLPLGDYRILREVGRGGMGVVYEAEQLSLGRRIALKVLPFALTLDPKQLQRFKNEARAAAQLHHQHIVPVYAVGSERGVHFYAMQYIEGQSLAEVIQDLKRQERSKKDATAPTPHPDRAASTGPYLPQGERASGDASALPVPETAEKPLGALATSFSANSSGFYRTVARLGIQAAEALEHAHQYGVVHRDIKPGNLMVDGHGHLWITDFGLAQFQSDAGLTQTGDLLGTLRYMSPEQAGGQRCAVDHRTDIYSLGVTLYELLTLHPPFEGGDRHTLLHQILNEEPYPPRAFHKTIPVELETIVLKALAKAPSERYATARELADDLSRYLDYQPIRARRATAAQRVRKWARRHPSVVWAAVVLCLLTVFGSLVGAELIRLKTQAAYQREKQRAQEAEEEFKLAREAVDGMFKLCEEELADKPFLDGLRRRLLQDYFLVYYQKLIDQRRDDAAVQAQLLEARERVQRILMDLADLQGAAQYHHLKDAAVVEELRPDGEQRQQIHALTDAMDRRWEEAMRQVSHLTSDNRLTFFLDFARATDRQAKTILTPAQLHRLRQIDLQRKGPRAFEDADVIAALHLSDRQREKIRAIQAQAFCSAFDGHACPPDRPAPNGPPKGRPKGPPPFEAVEQIKAEVLTKEQTERWEELAGKPFAQRGRFPFPPYGPPPRH